MSRRIHRNPNVVGTGLIVVGGGVGAYALYRWWTSRSSAPSAAHAAAPVSTAAAAPVSGFDGFGDAPSDLTFDEFGDDLGDFGDLADAGDGLSDAGDGLGDEI